MKRLRIAIVGNPDKTGVRAAVRDLARMVAARPGLRLAGVQLARSADLARLPADLFLALGGDGTVLSVCRRMGERQRPVLGIKFGHKGFLAEVQPEEMKAAVERLAAGHYAISERLRVEGEVRRGGRAVERLVALNDLVVHSGPMARVIFLEIRVDGELVSSYDADGVILSTPTGSTAYSLSAGGPILLPGLDAFVLTPICPHTLTQRPLVVPDSAVLEVTPYAGAPARLTVDGQEGAELAEGDRVRVQRSEHPVLLLVSPQRSRFDVLRAKLRWGER